MPEYWDKETLEELYVDQQRSMKSIAEEFDCSTPTIKRWLDRHGIPTRNQAGHEEQPWHSEERLRELYEDDDLSVHEIAEEFGVQDYTIEYWLTKHEINGKKAPMPVYDGNPLRHEWKDGYEVIVAWPDRVLIHRLIVVAEYGLDHVDNWSDYHVHHKNGIKWDNRPCNLEVLTPQEHSAIHAEQRTKAQAV